jgi:hypothetical protein
MLPVETWGESLLARCKFGLPENINCNTMWAVIEINVP